MNVEFKNTEYPGIDERHSPDPEVKETFSAVLHQIITSPQNIPKGIVPQTENASEGANSRILMGSFTELTFEKAERLGGGNFAAVYRVKEVVADGKKLDVKLALKLAESDDDSIRQIESEIKFIQALHQRLTEEERGKIFPNIHKVTHDDKIGYLTELYEGDMLKYLKTNPSMEEKLKVAAQLMEQMAILSKYGVIYSDIKPENVLLKNGMAVLSDFGDCQLLSERKETGLSLTHSPKFVCLEDTEVIDNWESMDEKSLSDRSNEHQARALGLILCSLFNGEEISLNEYYRKSELEEYIEANPLPLPQSHIIMGMLDLNKGEAQLTPIKAWELWKS